LLSIRSITAALSIIKIEIHMAIFFRTRAASIARQASTAGIAPKAKFMVTPGSEQIRATIERDGILTDLESAGASVLANACGPCSYHIFTQFVIALSDFRIMFLYIRHRSMET
jgi:predicted aconitase